MGKLIDLKNMKSFSMSASETKAEITIYGAIGESIWEDSISAKMISEELKKLPASVKEISIRMNSPGGSVFDGMTIYERLKQHKAKKIVYIDGLAASIASIIALAGDEIVIGEGAMMMIHKPMSGLFGNSDELLKMVDILDKIESQMVSIYAKRTGLSRNEIATMLSKETWLTCDECLDMCFADKKIEASENLHIAASLTAKAEWIKNKPEFKNTKNLIVKNGLIDLKKRIEDFKSRK